MNKIKNFFKSLWKDESAQGMAEYVLLIVVVVAIALVFKDRIKGIVMGEVGKVEDSLKGFGTD